MDKPYAIMTNIDSKKNERVYSIYIQEINDYFELISFTGLQNGKKIKTTKEIKKCKNIGKKNETSLKEQAISEANALIRKKQEKGYKFVIIPKEYITKTNCKELSTTDIYPMLCEKYKEQYVTYPVYIQPKLDGVRAIYNNGKLESRTKKIFNTVKHILLELKELEGYNYIFDGELYNHNMKFQEIISKVTLEKNLEEKTIEYHIFDIIDLDKPFLERKKILEDIKQKKEFKFIKFVETVECKSKDKLESFIEYFSDYEGVIIRNLEGYYRPKNRSKDVLKYKKFLDKEYKIVSFTEGTGIEKNCIIWICETENKELFNVRPCGSREERIKLYNNGNSYIGKYLTVKFQEKTNKNIPRFPVGISIRDYE